MAAEPAPAIGVELPYDVGREREFYKYFEPLTLGLAGQVPNTHAGQRLVRASPDRSLTAFAQLTTLRLDCRRSFISFFDRKHQYLVAEATRSLSLRTDAESEPGDEIQYGCTIVPKKGSICEHVVALPFDTEEYARDASLFMVEDLRRDERFNTMDYTVTKDWRFYAGTPIISPGGYKIGVICVIDDKPRQGVSQEDRAFLMDMATTVMVHMDRLRASSESVKGERMVRGLGSFVEGKSRLEEWWMYQNDKSKDEAAESFPELNQPWADRQYSTHHGKITTDTDTPVPKRFLGVHLDVEEHHPRRGSHAYSEGSIKPMKEDPKVKKTSKVDTLSIEVKQTFGRATRIIRDALRIDAVCCFDAKAGHTFGGLVDQHDHERPKRCLSSDSCESSVCSETDDPATDSDTPAQTKSKDVACEILGVSTVQFDSIDGDQSVKATDSMTEGFLRSLLRRYPHGNIFSFDEGDNSATTKIGLNDSSSTKKRKRLRPDEVRQIKAMFPGVRSLVMVPMWDSRQHFFSACVAWTVDPHRILTTGEIAYLAAFGDSIMAEVARIDAKIADKSKGDVLSSISHELRSPLHGILGSVECLQDSALDPFQENLVHTLETCGKTLLDTIDHLLDFAKVNNFARKNQRRTNSSNGDQQQNFALDVDVDLSVITEEVLESVFAGHDFIRSGQNAEQTDKTAISENPVTKRGVSVVVDIDKASNSHWIFRTQAGAWRRVLMNLFGNSLKYTDRGFIQVKLQAEPLPPKSKEGRSKVTLTVIDSGKGIGKDYLDRQLFVPFAQEDSLQPGTGLGLAITSGIVRSMGGDINVKSEQGYGTEVTVQLEMVHAPASQESLEQSIISTAASKMKGLKIGFVGFEADSFRSLPEPNSSRSPDNAYYLFMSSFHSMVTSWFGMDMQIVHGLDQAHADVFLTTEYGLDQLEDQLNKHMKQQPDKDFQNQTAQTPFLVICDSVAAANTMMHNQKPHITGVISQPCGPRKLAKALTLTLELFKNIGDPSKAPTVHQILDENTSSDNDFGDSYHQKNEPKKTKQKDNIKASDPPLTLSHPTLNQNKNSRNVLLVDDNKINLQLLVTFMKKSGHNFTTATNGLEAFEVYKSQCKISKSDGKTRPPFDYCLMDLSMPIMGGLESTRHIRAHERDYKIKPSTIIALTGLASASAQQEAYSSGIDTFMTKPVKLKELSKILEQKDDKEEHR